MTKKARSVEEALARTYTVNEYGGVFLSRLVVGKKVKFQLVEETQVKPTEER